MQRWRHAFPWRLGVILCGVDSGRAAREEAQGRDLMVPGEQVTTEFEPTETPSLDVQQKGVPQSLFTWIKMARGYEVEWDTFGRKGGLPRIHGWKPIAPGTTVFTPDASAVYIVFEVVYWKIQLSSLRRSFVSVSTARRGSRCRPG